MRSLLVVGVLAISGSAFAGSGLCCTFDSDNMNWRQGDFKFPSPVISDVGPATWNPAGYIGGNDFAGWAFHLSPELSGGFQGAIGISFRYSADFADAQPHPILVLRNDTQAIYREEQVSGDGRWRTYSYILTDADSWLYGDAKGIRVATMADIDSVLAGLTRIGINADVKTGADFTRVVDVAIVPVPEPASLLVLGGASILALRKRRVRV